MNPLAYELTKAMGRNYTSTSRESNTRKPKTKMLNISSGKISAPVRSVFYGPEGIGKSTFATWAPNPLFLDVEAGTRHLDVQRLEDINGWEHVTNAVQALTKDHHGFKTLVIDTIDWLEKLGVEYLCSTHNKDGLEGFGYGKGHVYVKELFDRLLNDLDNLVNSGMHVVILAHSIARKHEDPGRAGSYDRYELKLSRHVAPLIKEWADLLVFMNYKTVITEGDRGNVVAGGKERLLHTTHTAAYDAKNRHELADVLPMDWESVAPAFAYERKSAPATKKAPANVAPKEEIPEDEQNDELEASTPPPKAEEAVDPLTEETPAEGATEVQITNCKNLWSKCLEKLGYGADKMKQIWKFYDLAGKPGMWGSLTKPQAAKVIDFLTTKLESESA